MEVAVKAAATAPAQETEITKAAIAVAMRTPVTVIAPIAPIETSPRPLEMPPIKATSDDHAVAEVGAETLAVGHEAPVRRRPSPVRRRLMAPVGGRLNLRRTRPAQPANTGLGKRPAV